MEYPNYHKYEWLVEYLTLLKLHSFDYTQRANRKTI